jgi:hypothetical protein
MLALPMLLTSAGAVLAVAALLGLLAAGKLGLPARQTLTWTLPGTVPIALAVTACALTAGRATATLPPDTLRRLRFPLHTLLPAAAGMIAIQIGFHDPIGTTGTLTALLGAAALGAASGLLITPHDAPIVLRAITAALFALIYALAVTVHTTGALAAGYLIAASAWWLLGAGHLTYQSLRTLVSTSGH